ncbi:glycosyltransferase family 1 protein [uncultured Vagococcus sp.]|uniref:glycosyltransferase family 1 protein n=1 Tax=uncultured Vagococcus sp. TaxID=189676 RepID=UPI0028D3FA7A|nr:glycosyltransferase family 1 protein [uncultured Vagococcus sp.]
MAIKRILHFQGRMGKGGAETFMMNVYRAIDRQEFQFDFVIYDDYQDVRDYHQEIEALGGRLFVVTNPKKNILKYIKEVNRLLKMENIDIVHNQVYFGGGINLGLAKRHGIEKRIAHSHATTDGKGENVVLKGLRSFFKYLLLKNGTEFVACSTEAGKSLFGDSQPFEVIYNGIDLKLFQKASREKSVNRRNLNLKEDEFVLGTIGRIEKQKNHELLIKIFFQLLKIQPNSRLVLIGDGSLREEVLAKASELAISDKILYLGERNDIPELLSVMDVFVLTSLYEGLPTVAVEAQATQLKLVLTNTISRETKLTDNVTFLPLETKPDVWATTILELPRDNQVTEQLLAYDYVITADKMVKIYKR